MIAGRAAENRALFVFIGFLPAILIQGRDAQFHVDLNDQENEANAEEVNGLGDKACYAPDERKREEERVEYDVRKKAVFLGLQIKLSE